MLVNFVILLFYHSCDLDFRLVITLNYFKLLLITKCTVVYTQNLQTHGCKNVDDVIFVFI